MSFDEPARDFDDIRAVDPESIEVIDTPQTRTPVWRTPPPYQFRRRKRLALFLFLATCASTFLVGSGLIDAPFDPAGFQRTIEQVGIRKKIAEGAMYSASIMAILLAHEMGHFLQARRNHVPATMPLFIPMPIPPFGTMGAVIVQGAGYANRKSLFDIAVSGPLAGLVLALPILFIGIQLSTIIEIPSNAGGLQFGKPLLFQWGVKYIHGDLPPGHDVLWHPLAFAGWVGVFITALNLVPVGQFDGGHVLYTLIGKPAHYVAIGVLWGALGYYMLLARYPAYLLMIFLMFLMGPRHPPTADDTVPLGMGRIILGWATLSFIIVGFTPTPIVM